MTYDVEALRSHFPSLATGLAHFDGPGGTQTPLQVGQAIARALTGPLSNRGRASLPERNADDAVTGFRQAMADLLGADPGGIVCGRSATQLTYDFSRALSAGWAVGDEVVVTRLDHDSNIRPWVQAAERAGAVVRWVDFDPETGELPAAAVASVLSERTRLVAVTAASNLIGTRPPIAEIAALVHAAGALLYVDGVHYAAHASVDLGALGADFFVCSPYKFLGPHCGVLAAAPELLETIHPDKLLPSSNQVPERFELGTLPYELMAGATAAVDFLAGLGTGATGAGSRRERLVASSIALAEYEDGLRAELEQGLAALPGATVHSRAAERTPTLLVTFADRVAADASRFLADRGILAPAGSFYALEASRHLGLGEAGGLRIGLAPYNTEGEVSRLLAALEDFALTSLPSR
ncbi:cysteine desulfurase-like protein [Cryobacterium sp. Sr8]|uniref:cysteine desulfurase-like protein n=1 Tax=Cryobacterium sp. Sr8 TaxID=1259203 RepID=UPI00106B11F2|nr:cysteine desulfurase-like protein [Cryobacterium sp. Sr8]TFD74452.1 cysteine desulfurase-like protein [Cryobacterium sp. Sr8]